VRRAAEVADTPWSSSRRAAVVRPLTSGGALGGGVHFRTTPRRKCGVLWPEACKRDRRADYRSDKRGPEMTQSPGDGTATALHDAVHEPHDDAPRPAHDASSYVLVVDDEELIRDFMARCLEDRGYAVKKAENAAEALELMVNKPASLALCDIRMPGQDGLWLADRLRAHWPNTPVVMVTGIDDVETVRLSREVGAVDYITKPIARDQLLQVVRRAATPPSSATRTSEDSAPPSAELPTLHGTKVEAEYTLESPVRCPACGERITTVKAVRLVRAQVNFTSTLPRRGRVVACPHCLAVIPAELSNF